MKGAALRRLLLWLFMCCWAASGWAALTIDTASLPNGIVGLNYKATLSASGGTQPYTWAITAGMLPPGANLANQPGIISGVPAKAGTFQFTVQVTDKDSKTATKQLSITIAAPLGDLTISIGNGEIDPKGQIWITFEPAEGGSATACKSIVWVQVVQRYAVRQGNPDNKAILTKDTDWPGDPNSNKKVRDETEKARARVDRPWGNNYPYYGAQNSGIPKPGRGYPGKLTMKVGYTGPKPASAYMVDTPNTPEDNFPEELEGKKVNVTKAILKFEAAPFCIDGDLQGQYLGWVVTWESHQVKGEAPLAMNANKSQGQPSDRFLEAVEKWCAGNSPNGKAPWDRRPFNLPQPK